MTNLDAIIIGIVQGLTEFLPISSSGHLVVVRYFYGVHNISLHYIVLLHVGTLVAVCAALWRDIVSIIGKVVRREPDGLKIATAILITMIPAGLVGFYFTGFLDRIFCEDGYKFNNGMILEPYKFVGAAFIATAYFIIGPSDDIIKDRIKTGARGKDSEGLTYMNALVIGLFQALAVIPGISRSGATIYAGLRAGLSRDFAARFSFLMSIPIILGAFLKDVMDPSFRIDWVYKPDQRGVMLLGVAIAAVVGFFAIKLLLKIITTRDLRPFVVYLWIIGLLCIAS